VRSGLAALASSNVWFRGLAGRTEIDTKKFLEYLDKEMTIMGILSAVCVAAPAGILNAVLSKDSEVKALFWIPGHFLIVAGTASGAPLRCVKRLGQSRFENDA
jgi:hypothetical protein